MEYYSAIKKNSFESVLMRWMKLEPIIHTASVHLNLNLPVKVSTGFPCGSAGKESACNVRGLGLIPGLGRSPGEGKGYPLQYSGLKNSMDCTVHGITELDMAERLSKLAQL